MEQTEPRAIRQVPLDDQTIGNANRRRLSSLRTVGGRDDGPPSFAELPREDLPSDTLAIDQ
jgi:hypothetical protein